MAFTFTPPDPLNSSAVTRSIFITELQDAANVKRNEISQSLLSFIDQDIGKTFLLSAIEELKVVINQLAIDFGFSGGVTNVDLLGRPYVEITEKFDLKITSFPIINDLRQVLNLLEVQGFDPAQFVSTGWFTVAPIFGTLRPLGNWSQQNGNPYPTTPIDQFIPGEVDNTLPTFRGTILAVTDRSILFTFSGTVQEGPLGGPFFAVPVPEGGGNIDEEFFYFFKVNGPDFDIVKRKRDGSEAEIVLDTVPDPSVLAVGPSFIYSINALTNQTYTRTDKTGGQDAQFTLDFLNLPNVDTTEPGSFITAISKRYFGPGVYRDSVLHLPYRETFRHFSPSNPTVFTFHAASAIIKIPDTATSSADITVSQDLDACSREGLIGDVSTRTKHNGAMISALGDDDGFWYIARINGCQAINTDEGESFLPTDDELSYNGLTFISGTLDYLGNTIIESAQIRTLTSWDEITGSFITADIDPNDLAFDTAVRQPGLPNTADVTWSKVDGVFRYRLQRRAEGSIVWITTSTVASNATLSGTITGLQPSQNYFVRILAESGQGFIEGPETFLTTL